MENSVKPIYLLADSQILFWKNKDKYILEPAIDLFQKQHLKAAYIGASNKDHPAYFQIFTSAMTQLDINDFRMISMNFPEEDEWFLNQADLILLAGGDVKVGWEIILKKGINDILLKKYYGGSLLIGISAGAIQLGLHGWYEKSKNSLQLFDTLKLVPLIIDVHNESEGWGRLKETTYKTGNNVTGMGIPLRAGMVYHPDHIVEVLRFPLQEYRLQDGVMHQNLIFPD